MDVDVMRIAHDEVGQDGGNDVFKPSQAAFKPGGPGKARLVGRDRDREPGRPGLEVERGEVQGDLVDDLLVLDDPVTGVALADDDIPGMDIDGSGPGPGTGAGHAEADLSRSPGVVIGLLIPDPDHPLFGVKLIDDIRLAVMEEDRTRVGFTECLGRVERLKQSMAVHQQERVRRYRVQSHGPMRPGLAPRVRPAGPGLPEVSPCGQFPKGLHDRIPESLSVPARFEGEFLCRAEDVVRADIPVLKIQDRVLVRTGKEILRVAGEMLFERVCVGNHDGDGLCRPPPRPARLLPGRHHRPGIP
ncbi:MAG: hypothetical protein BWX50_00344 [Euryarchaeota archaeon ADurb.Bin009]|nr:MAG: hypothetical protein BWX50_00344 [Euryarchaeota archaeon ADurb.Bin009]